MNPDGDASFMNPDGDAGFPCTRERILAFPFPAKLWIVINDEGCEFLNWDVGGSFIELNLVGLDAYLTTRRSIFNSKQRSTFLQNLSEFGFKRQCVVEGGRFQVYYHEYFQRGHINLMQNIHRVNTATEISSGRSAQVPISSTGNAMITENVANPDDPCSRQFGFLSKAERTRVTMQVTNELEAAKEMLNKVSQPVEPPTVSRHLQLENNELASYAVGLQDPPAWGEKFNPECWGYCVKRTQQQIVACYDDMTPKLEQTGKRIENATATPETFEQPQTSMQSKESNAPLEEASSIDEFVADDNEPGIEVDVTSDADGE